MTPLRLRHHLSNWLSIQLDFILCTKFAKRLHIYFTYTNCDMVWYLSFTLHFHTCTLVRCITFLNKLLKQLRPKLHSETSFITNRSNSFLSNVPQYVVQMLSPKRPVFTKTSHVSRPNVFPLNVLSHTCCRPNVLSFRPNVFRPNVLSPKRLQTLPRHKVHS